MSKFIVTAFSTLPANHLKDEPDIRVEVEADSSCTAAMLMMRQCHKPNYYYVTIAKRRHNA